MMLTTAQAAERLQTSQEHIQRLCKSGTLPAVNLSPGKKRATYRISEADLIVFQNRHRAAEPVRPQRRKRRREVFDFIG